MGRAIASIILGYVLMAVLVFVTFSAAYLVMGPDGSFKPGSYDISATWLITSIVLSIVAAVAGGYVCAAVARSVKPARILAVVVVVLGLAMAFPALTTARPRRDRGRRRSAPWRRCNTHSSLTG
jgi:hypothetical protein